MNFAEAISKIEPIDEKIRRLSMKRWDDIAKPLRSLGKLEDGIAQIAGISRNLEVNLDKKALVIMCADNGVVEEGISQSGSDVTAIVSENFLDMNSCACIMAKQNGADVFPIDIGIGIDTKVPNKKIAYGTKNMAKEPAMTREEVIRAIEVGINQVLELREMGYQIIATGEMGIGNTTTSSAVASVLLDVPVEKITGKGAGLSDSGLAHKIQVIKDAIKMHEPNKEDPIDVVGKVGGLDIAGLVGVFLGGAVANLPVVIDGFISSVAALIALRLEPKSFDYMMPSHVSKENAGGLLLDAIGMKPYLTCDMCLGEGTGAVALFPLLDMGLAVYTRMSTFEDNDIEAYEPL